MSYIYKESMCEWNLWKTNQYSEGTSEWARYQRSTKLWQVWLQCSSMYKKNVVVTRKNCSAQHPVNVIKIVPTGFQIGLKGWIEPMMYQVMYQLHNLLYYNIWTHRSEAYRYSIFLAKKYLIDQINVVSQS